MGYLVLLLECALIGAVIGGVGSVIIKMIKKNKDKDKNNENE